MSEALVYIIAAAVDDKKTVLLSLTICWMDLNAVKDYVKGGDM